MLGLPLPAHSPHLRHATVHATYSTTRHIQHNMTTVEHRTFAIVHVCIARLRRPGQDDLCHLRSSGLCRKLQASLGIKNRNKSQTLKCQWHQGKHHPLHGFPPSCLLTPSRDTVASVSAARWLWDVRQVGDLRSPWLHLVYERR